jgi:hypothetical protein
LLWYRIKLGKEEGFHVRHVGMHRNAIFGEIVVDEITETRIESQYFLER